ncbi:MAG: cytochrome-c peroxidase [Planctomycetes bacterium]|nr:cytochrome-c peroxidase [Planctomycetota bacterium]
MDHSSLLPMCLGILFTGLLAPQDPGPEAPPRPRDVLPKDLFDRGVPEGLAPEMALKKDDVTRRRFDLGRRLFFDPVLSTDGSTSCASCHPPENGFASPERYPRGARGRRARRHAPTLFNRAGSTRQLWDGRAATLRDQVLMPIEDTDEMALPLTEALERLRADTRYALSFDAAYEDGVTAANLADALATFVEGLTTGDTVIDRFQAAKGAVLTPLQRTGLWIYESKGRCWQCHSGPNFTDEDFHNTGVGVVDGTPEPGRSAITSDPNDHGRFKTPTLRALAHTAPYMHDGSLATLEDVVAFYVRGGNQNPALDPRLAPLELTPHEKKALVAFLHALSE